MRPDLHDTSISDGQDVADSAVCLRDDAVRTLLVSSQNTRQTLSTPQTGLLAPHSGIVEVIYDERGGKSEGNEEGNHSRTFESRMCSRYCVT